MVGAMKGSYSIRDAEDHRQRIPCYKEGDTANEILHLKWRIQQQCRIGEGYDSLSQLYQILAEWFTYRKDGKNPEEKAEYISSRLGKPELGDTNPLRIDVGCGARKKRGFLGIDYMLAPNVDYVVDLEKSPLPFKDNSVSEVWSNHFLEHLTIDGICKVMEEIHRVCKPWAYVEIRVPHFSGLTNFYEFHKTSFRYNSFSEFTLGGWGMFESPALFYKVSTKINIVNRQSPKLHPHTWWYFWNYPIEWFVNKFPLFYELTGLRSIFPAWEVIFKMRVVK
jgi:SAM-dependent methyltransferase